MPSRAWQYNISVYLPHEATPPQSTLCVRSLCPPSRSILPKWCHAVLFHTSTAPNETNIHSSANIYKLIGKLTVAFKTTFENQILSSKCTLSYEWVWLSVNYTLVQWAPSPKWSWAFRLIIPHAVEIICFPSNAMKYKINTPIWSTCNIFFYKCISCHSKLKATDSVRRRKNTQTTLK